MLNKAWTVKRSSYRYCQRPDDRLPKIVGTERRVSEVDRQRIPGHRTGDRERPTAERAATMSWYYEMVAAGRSKSLTTGNVRTLATLLYWKSNYGI